MWIAVYAPPGDSARPTNPGLTLQKNGVVVDAQALGQLE
jgi:hypothetical protein